MKTDYIKWIITEVVGLAVLWTGGGRLMAQTTDTTEASTYSNGSSKAAKVAPSISIEYPKITSAYACVGDTIYVTATADNIEDLIVPVDNDIHKYWSGDADNAIVKKTDHSITKRFYTYHPYKKTAPTGFDFIIKHNGGTTTVNQTISAKSCPPDISPNPPKLDGTGTNMGQHNLGYIRFEFSCKNPTADTTITTFTDHFNPSQYWFRAKNPDIDGGLWNFRYRCIPVSDATYTVAVQFNEGDSLRTQSFGPYTINVTPLNAITTDNPAYCTGDDIVFTLDLPKLYLDILQQTINGDESKIAACFDWTGSPSDVTFTGITGTTCTFKTKAAETTTPYQCKMSVDLRYKATSNADIIRVPHTYNLPIAQFTVHSAQSLTQETIDACEGTTINLEDYLSGTGLTIDGYTTSKGSFTGTTYTVPGQTETIKVKINSGNCGIFEPDLTVNVTPKPQITQIQGISNGMEICAGTSLNVSASVTPEKADVMWQVDGVQVSDKPSTELFLSKDATVTVQASNTCGDTPEQSFTVKVNALPQVSMASLIEQCPGTTVTLSGSGNGSNANYQLRDLKTNQPIAPTGFDAATGLNGYPLAEGDDLELTYTAYNGKCPASATARITAHPLPEVQITYDGQAYGDGATLCVPRRQPFSLSASGANTYAWSQDGTGITTPDFNLADDAAVTVKGTDATTTCAKDITVQCVVSVNPDGSISETICPGGDVRFAADDLPDTKYVWRDPNGNSLGNSHEYQASDVQPGQEGEYQLEISRSTCTWTLPYQLGFHPYPQLSVTGITNPVCEGSELFFEYKHGLPQANIQSVQLTDNSGTAVSQTPTITADRIRYRIPDIQPAQAGRYTLTVTTDQGCTANDATDIIVGTHLIPVFNLRSAYCEEEAETLTTPMTGTDYKYHWFTQSRSLNAEDEPEPSVQTVWQRTDNGTLYLEIKQNGCTDTTGKPLNVIPRPHLSGLQDTGLCSGLPLCLEPISDMEASQLSSINWIFIGTDGSGKTFLPTEGLAYCWAQVDSLMSGRYYVRAEHQMCEGFSDTMQLTVHPQPTLRIEGRDFICRGTPETLTVVSSLPGRFYWLHSGDTAARVVVSQPGLYSVSQISEQGCADTAQTLLKEELPPYFSLPPDTSFCRGTSFMVYGPEGMDDYLWNDGLTEKDRLIEDGGWYALKVTASNECQFTDSIYVDETFCGQFHFPTAFTPNDNRVNDTWGAISAAKDEDMAEYDLMVFDRNGKKVFHGKRISEQWDGRYKGQLCPPGVYTYSFRALEKEEGLKYRSSGTVTIVL